MSDKTDKTVAETRAIQVHPWWHTVVYLLIFLILAVFTYLVLDDLTNRVNDANQRADANEAGVAALADQVEGLGGTPVVTPSDLPKQGEAGEAGETGDTGSTGPQGPAGQDGEDGTNGVNGRTGASGASGSPGGTGVAGTAGEPGEPGSDGQAGAPGADGAPGEPGKDGAQGAIGPVGPAGPPGADGADGADGQTCPNGYALEQRDIITAQNPLGEPGFVCVQSAAPPETDPVQEG